MHGCDNCEIKILVGFVSYPSWRGSRELSGGSATWHVYNICSSPWPYGTEQSPASPEKIKFTVEKVFLFTLLQQFSCKTKMLQVKWFTNCSTQEILVGRDGQASSLWELSSLVKGPDPGLLFSLFFPQKFSLHKKQYLPCLISSSSFLAGSLIWGRDPLKHQRLVHRGRSSSVIWLIFLSFLRFWACRNLQHGVTGRP